MGKTPRQRRKLKTNRGKRPGLSRKAQKAVVPKNRETRAAVLNISDPAVAAAWDVTKTRRKNFEDIGLVQDPNSDAPAKTIVKQKSRGRKRSGAQTAVVMDIEKRAAEAKGAKPVVAAPGEVQFVDALVGKHGDDYAAMARDHEINVYQHTAKQIERKVKRVQATLALAADA